MAGHQRSDSVPQARLTQPLPPLPRDDASSPSIIQPYHDDPAEQEQEEEQIAIDSTDLHDPPRYEPMHDYLANRALQISRMLPLQYASSAEPPQYIPLLPQEPYRDEPFIISIDASQPPPPSYDTLYQQHESEMENLFRTLSMEDNDSNSAEDICKWIVSMLLIALTVAGVGTAFNWGHPSCGWLAKCWIWYTRDKRKETGVMGSDHSLGWDGGQIDQITQLRTNILNT